MTDELERFYRENETIIAQSFAEFCFNEGRFETSQDARSYYNNDRNFWNFVENMVESKRSWG